MEEITTKILKLKPSTLGLIFILFPIISLIISGIISFISIFANFEVIFSLFEISITIIVLIHFIWIWGVINYVEEKEITNKIYFKIFYWIYFSYCLIMFIRNIGLDITKKEVLLENKTWEIMRTIVGFYELLVLISYSYISYFVAKKIKALALDHSYHILFYFGSAWVFPLGIPIFLQAKLQKQKSMFEKLTSRKSLF